MTDLDAIRARCEALDRLRAAHPDTTWTACIPNPVMALDDRRELLNEVERLQTRHASIKQSYDLEVESRVKAELKVGQLRKELTWEAMCTETRQEAIEEVETEVGRLQAEVEWLQTRHTSIKQSYNLEVGRRVRAELEIERLQRERDELRATAIECGQLRALHPPQYYTAEQLIADHLTAFEAMAAERDELKAEVERLPAMTEMIVAERDELRNEVKRLQTREATLQSAEATLAQSSIGGIYTEFDDLRDAIEQMAAYTKELSKKLERATTREVEFKRAVDWLYGFWDGNCLVVAPGCDAEALREAWADLINATVSSLEIKGEVSGQRN